MMTDRTRQAAACAIKESGMATEKANDSVRAVNRALDILMAFTATDYELTAAALLKRVDLSRPTLYRLLSTLEQGQFLISEGEPQKFRLGPSVAHLAHVWTSSLDINEIAQPMMRRVWEITGETVALFVPQGLDRLCVAEIPSLQPLSFKRGVGYKERLALGASGRAILAFRDHDQDQIKVLTEGIKVSHAQYETELELTRERGYAISREEVIAGAVAIAAPFFSGKGQAAGSIGVFGPSVRLNEERINQWGTLLKRESENLSQALGVRRS
jgi:IclR family acetate operon transcriptional repressor